MPLRALDSPPARLYPVLGALPEHGKATPMHHCTTCRSSAIVASFEGADVPKGAAFCDSCGEWSWIGGGNKLRLPTPAERERISASPTCVEVQQTWARSTGLGGGR
jgi:hypothetical protein